MSVFEVGKYVDRLVFVTSLISTSHREPKSFYIAEILGIGATDIVLRINI